MIDNDVDFNSLKEKSLKISGKLLYKIDLFDVYNGKELPKNKSHMELVFISTIMKTITDSEINIICNKLGKMFINSFCAELR